MNKTIDNNIPPISNSIEHYNEIPNYTLGKTILDLGSSDGAGALHSRYGYHFYNNDYIGVDIQTFSKCWLPVVSCNLFDFESPIKYDTVLMLHVLEHIPLEKWNAVFNKYRKLVRNGGYIVVNVPFKELEQEKQACSYQDHKVFNIDEKKLRLFCDFDKVHIVRTYAFRENYEGFLKPLLRFFHRIFTRNPLSFISRYRNPVRIVGVLKVTN